MDPRMERYMNDRTDRMYERDDGRNPYGSRGGYVTSRRPGRRDRGYDDGGYYEGTFRGNSDRTYRDRYDRMHDMYDDGTHVDYASQRVLTPEELNEWKHKLLSMITDSVKPMFADDAIIKKARSMNVRFEDFTEDELIVTALMMYTDYWKVCGKGNPEKYISMAEMFLMDEDAAIYGGEKLATYHDCIVKGM